MRQEDWVASVVELLDAVDRYVPDPVRVLDRPFLMSVENVMTISGRGTVVTGEVDRGVVAVGDPVGIVGLGRTRPTVVTSIESFHKTADRAMRSDNTAMLLRGIKGGEVVRGHVIGAAGRITPHARFEAQIYALRTEEGGGHKPFFTGYRPQFFFRTTDVNGALVLEQGSEMVMPGDAAAMTVELGKPIVMDEGLGFAVPEGGKTVGARTVTSLLATANEIRMRKCGPPVYRPSANRTRRPGSWASTKSNRRPFEPMSKRRRGFPQRGQRQARRPPRARRR